MSKATSTDVLVVGAGPTGLTLACELLRRGLRARIIDALAEPVTTSKAAAVHARTMEILDSMGVGDRFLAAANVLGGFNVYTHGKRAGHVRLDGVESRFPFVYGISQHDTEKMLTARLGDLGGAVERGVKLESFVQTDDGVTATVTGAASTTIEAAWLVGCDGAHSAVRKGAGFSFDGKPYEQSLIQADVKVDWPGRQEHDEIHAFLHPDGPLLLLPLFNEGRYRLIAVFFHGDPVEPTLEIFQKLLDERGPKGAVATDPSWMVPFRIHLRATNKYRDRRVFIAGDAAHIHSPAGGQGMNTGMQDAFNLAWKLALVHSGKGKPALLDSYEAERLPIARAVLGGSDTAMRAAMKLSGWSNPLAGALRDQLISLVTSLGFVRENLGRAVSQITVAYPNSPICRQDRASIGEIQVVSDRTNESPSIGDYWAFGEGPAPGCRATDLDLGGDARFFDFLRTTRHVLFLFDGAAATEQGYRNFVMIANDIEKRYAGLVDVHVIVPYAKKPEALGDLKAHVVLDAQGEIHKAYGARSECLYVVRPDGYVGYRAQPADEKALMAYFDSIFP